MPAAGINVISKRVSPERWFAALNGSTADDNDMSEKPSTKIKPILLIF